MGQDAWNAAAKETGALAIAVVLIVSALGRSGLALPLVIVAPRANDAEVARLSDLARASGVTLEVHIGITDSELVRLYRGALATLYLAEREPGRAPDTRQRRAASTAPEHRRGGNAGVGGDVAVHTDPVANGIGRKF